MSETVPEPGAEPAPAAETVGDAPAPAEGHFAEPTLLEGVTQPAAEAAPAEPPAPSEEPAAAAAPAETPAAETPVPEAAAAPTPEAPAPAPPAELPPMTYEPFTFPEGVTADDKIMTDYTAVLAEHRLPQETGQRLVDMHIAAMTSQAEALAKQQHDVFAETRRNWRNEIMADEQMGGAGFETAKLAVAQMRDLFVPPERMDAFNNMLRVTGVGDHPEFWRLLHNASRRFKEPSPITPNGPAPDRGAARGRGNGSFRSTMYDHPTSQRGAR